MTSSVDPEDEASDAPVPPQPDDGEALAPALYIVATPIGNLQDITLRALDMLRRVDMIACEDTRVTAKLLTRHGIHAPTTPYHDANAERARPALLRRLQGGAAIALVSDAGTPLVSDPGFKLVREAIAAGIRVVPIPGASAVLTALMVAGLPTDRFLFVGFLPSRQGQRLRALEEMRDVRATLVVLEAQQRLAESLADMQTVFGPREAVIARELTKHFEETVRGTLGELAARYESAPPKGEIVIVIAPPAEADRIADDAEVDVLLKDALQAHSPSDAAADVARRTGRTRREVYARALALRQK
ncbi:MAG: 16S rRNA (cytidine(1402)-2'-O)-methyltransferase [Alphaproteobacteria bacterium]|nr:16S rRNA (cytidine(1402)-2'-O)-methyltransferase [Alphaproteobacteria bacterium]